LLYRSYILATYLGIGGGSLKAGGGTEGLLGRGERGGGANEERCDSELHLGGVTTQQRVDRMSEGLKYVRRRGDEERRSRGVTWSLFMVADGSNES